MVAPVVRVSKGRFAPENYERVKELIEQSAGPLVPAIRALDGLMYYHAAVDPETSTVMNVSIWASMDAAKQLDTLAQMLAQRPILEGAGVTFEKIANYEPLWAIEAVWRA
jgi:hypothetical protein